MNTAEHRRLEEDREGTTWKEWGPYLSERQWATVREDYSEEGNAWEAISHDQSRSKAYRWGEDGIGGFSNSDQRICFAWAFWNGKDPIVKERLFGLTGYEGNHGEDVKELYYYLDNTPTHSYMRMLYKYPQNKFPYKELVEENTRRSKEQKEYELIDTGIFDNDEYFDLFLNYAKADPNDFLFECEIHNRNSDAADLYVIPTLWFRNTWSSGRDKVKPTASKRKECCINIEHHLLGNFVAYFEDADELVFCNNETNRKKLYGTRNTTRYPKDAINNYVTRTGFSLNTHQKGTKSAAIFRFKVPGNGSKRVRIRLTREELEHPFNDFDSIIGSRKKEADEFYGALQKRIDDQDVRSIQRQAFAGMLWSKQFYYYNVKKWLDGDTGRHAPPESRKQGRNSDWQHLINYDIISMPDKWEYPWYAAWDLAFHCIPLSRVDPDFAKEQLLCLLKEGYIHPNGQIPAYEWNFSDVNPPVHAWAVHRVYQNDKRMNGKGDIDFLLRAFNKLSLNFTWWVNRKDENGNNVFEGGFLGLDNIGVFDRNHPIVEDAHLEQADSTSWMAMFSLNMMRIALELSMEHPGYQDMAIKYFEHFLFIGGAMNSIGDTNVDLWDEEENFYYDVIHTPDETNRRMKVRSMVGLIPLYAVEILKESHYKNLPRFRERLEFFLKERPQLASLVAQWDQEGKQHRRLISILRGFRMMKILERMLNPDEFLSDYGIRALSKYHKSEPYIFEIDGHIMQVKYLPGESDSSFFGGNSNWRGPIWFPVNYLLMESLLKFHYYYGEDVKVEFPTGSGKELSLLDITKELYHRMLSIFTRDENGNRPVYAKIKKFQKDPHFKDYILFYEYFHGDTGEGLGASHQTGWTGMIAEMIYRYYEF